MMEMTPAAPCWASRLRNVTTSRAVSIPSARLPSSHKNLGKLLIQSPIASSMLFSIANRLLYPVVD